MTPLTPLTATRDKPMPIDALGEAIAELAARIHAATYELLVMLRDSWMWRRRVPHRMWSASSAHPARSAGNQTLRRVDRAIAAKHADARHLSRHLTTWIDADGMVVLRGRLTPGQFDGALEVDDTAVHGSAETSKRLACDAAVVRMRHDADSQVLDVGRKTRAIPSAVRRALSTRDTRCQFPGCSARRCDAHHIEHWVDGGPTSLDNLVLLCRRHHRLVHEGSFTVGRQPDRTVAFFYADSTRFVLAPPQPRFDLANPLAPTTDRLAVQGIAITPRTLPTWDGTPFNTGYAIDVLYEPRRQVVS